LPLTLGQFSVKYFLNLVLVDEEDRRYFKQQEITLWRKAPKTAKKDSEDKNEKKEETAGK
jgi:vacuolar protein sorting-associated protein 26